jgi:outer membrane protein assembly factor BamB
MMEKDSSQPRETESTMESSRRVSCLFRLVSLLVVLMSVWANCFATTAQAQMFRFPGLNGAKDAENEESGLQTERRVETKLKQMKTAADSRKISEVLEHIESLRAADPMLVVRGSDKVYVPLHRNLIQLIQSFSPEVRDAIEKSDPGADAALRQAIESNSALALPTFLQRYAGTKAAGKASLLLAAQHADRGHELAAQYWLAPLLTQKADPELKAIAEKLNAQFVSGADPSQAATIPGGERKADETNSLESTERATNTPDSDSDSENVDDKSADDPTQQNSSPDMAVKSADGQEKSPTEAGPETGAVSNVDAVEQSFIQQRHWYKSLPIAAATRTRSQQLLRESRQLKAIPWSAWEPELDAEHVFVRAPGLISAYRLSSGQHVWTRTLAQEQSPAPAPEPDFPGGRFIIDRDPLRDALNSAEILQLHRNERVGRMTSDDERLYLVSQLSTGYGPSLSRGMMRIRGGNEQFSAGLWELIAVDKKTGRRLWTMGGAPVEEKFGNELAEAWLAGPPTVDRGSLYQVIETNSVVHLVCLEAATGRIRWRIPLAYPENGIELDVKRQLLAAQTTAKDGVVYTTSTTGWLFAIDTLTHSIQWVRKLAGNVTENQEERMLRDSGMFVPDLAPLGEAWRSQSPILLGDNLLVPTAESGQLLCVDARNGKNRITSVSGSGATVVLHSDEEYLVVASTDSIMGFALPKLKKSWTLKLKESNTPPVGPGSRHGDDLYVPLADGSAAVVMIADGTLKRTLRRFRPAWSTGGLYATQGRILSHAPDHLTLLSMEPATGHDDTDPLQHALFLFESGDLKEASLATAKIPVTALRRDALRRLKFRIAVAMLKAQDGTGSNSSAAELIAKEASRLEEIAGMAQTAQEKALTHFLRLDFLTRTAPENVVPSMIDALILDESVLAVDIPVTSNIRELLTDASGSDPLARNPLRPGSDQRFITFRAWVLTQLRERIAQATEKERSNMILGLAAVPDATILEMHSKDLTDEYLRRAELQLQSGECTEVVLQLLMAAADAQLDTGSEKDEQKPTTTTRIAQNFQKARELMRTRADAETVHQELVDRIVATVQFELQGKQPGMNLVAPDDIGRTIRERVADAPELPLTMLPVSSVGRVMVRMSGKSEIYPYSPSDSVLSAFRWTARSVPSVIQARSLREPLRPEWGLTHEMPENPNELKNQELYRFGSILILADSQGLSAFSVAEQRWLWRRTIVNGFVGRRGALRERTFLRVESGIRFAMMSFNGVGLSICGGSSRWVCLKTDDTVEVLDLYSGNRLWGTPAEDSYSSTLAFRSGIFRCKGFNEMKKLNPIDGKEGGSPPAIIASLPGVEIMRHSGDSLLALRRNTATNQPILQWIDATTGQVSRSIELPSKSWAYVPDQETMALLSETGDLKVINLMNGDQQDFADARSAMENTLPKDVTKLAFNADALNCYIYEADDNAMGQFTLDSFRIIPVKTAVVAFSRQTGKQAWVRPVKAPGSMYLDGPEEVVVFVEEGENAAPNAVGRRVFNIPGLGMQMGQTHVLHGLSRTTGNSRFSYKATVQRPFPEIRLTKTTANQLDLEAYGNRVRFVSTPVAAAP